MNQFKCSPHQEAVLEAVRECKENLIVQAFAGSGKTTLCSQAFMIHPDKKTLNLLFNKKNAKEAEEKNKKLGLNHVKSTTIHSLCYGSLIKNWGSVSVSFSGERMKKIISSHPKSKILTNPQKKILADSTSFLRSYNNILYSNFLFFLSMSGGMNFFDTDKGKSKISNGVHAKQGFEICVECIEQSLNPSEIIDVDDMIYVTDKLGFPLPSFDYVYCDEFQDMNEINHSIICRLAKNAKQVVAVGDRYQSIYSWRGADPRSMDNGKKSLNMKEFSLPETFRCSLNVVNHVKKIVPQFTARENAPLGSVTSLRKDEIIDQISAGDMIVSRKTAPLAKILIKMFKSNIPARIEKGSDSSKDDFGIGGLIQKYEGSTTREMLKKLEMWKDLQIQKLKDEKQHHAIENVKDKFETILAFSEGTILASEVIQIVDNFSKLASSKEGVSISTVHRAKGMEAKNVFSIEEHYLSSKSMNPEEEINIKYVGHTRAIENLILVY